MKRQEIREAYDRMNPPQDAKERMMRNMMKRTNKRKESTARPTPYSRWTAIPAMLALAAILAVGGWMLWPEATPNPLLDLAPPIESTEGFLFVEPKDYAAQFAGVDNRYQEILVTYAQAIDENWSEQQWTGAGLNAELYSEVDNAGYVLCDLDGNGSDELLICTEGEIYELYTIFNGDAKELLNWKIDYQATRISIRFCEGDFVKVVQKTAGGGTSYNIYRLGTDGLGDIALVMERHVLMTDDGNYYAGPNEKDAEKVSEAEAMGTLDGYQAQTIPLTLFNGTEQQEPDDVVPPGFAYIVSKYVQAYNEKWTVEQYMENDISYALHGKSIFGDYGYALMDLNDDGVNELLITDGDIIYDLYILMEDREAGHVFSAGERLRYFLCDDNVIGYRGSGGAAYTTLEYSRLLPNGDMEIQMRLQSDESGWYKSEDGSDKMVAIIEDEVRHIQDFFVALKIPYQSMMREFLEISEERHYPATYAQLLKDMILLSPGVADMFVSLVDVTGDGNSELLLGTEDSFGHVYTITNGEVDYILSYGTDEGFTLCEDGVLMYHSPNDEFDYYDFISMKDSKPITIDNIRYDAEEQSWYRYKSGSKEYLTDEEMQKVIASYGALSVMRISVQEYLDGES